MITFAKIINNVTLGIVAKENNPSSHCVDPRNDVTAPMQLKNLSRTWPPPISKNKKHVNADFQDVVVSVKNQGGNRLTVKLRKPGEHRVEYDVTFRLPEHLFQKTLLSIIRRNGTTLAEVGDISIW
jgi:hypothetical protein